MKPPRSYDELVKHLEEIDYFKAPLKERKLTKEQLFYIRQKWVIEEVDYRMWHDLRGDGPSLPSVHLGESLEDSMIVWL